MKIRRLSLLFIFIIAGLFSFNNCDLPQINLLHEFPKLKGVETGNPFSPSMKIVQSTCDVLMKAHSELTQEKCQNGVLSTSFSDTLGVPPQTLNPFWTLVSAEQAGIVQANQSEVDPCLTAIGQLDPTSPQVQGAYDAQLFNPFIGVAQMMPGGYSSCPNLYRGSAFPSPTPTPIPDPQIVVVNFDNPPPPPSLLSAIYQGIDFSGGGLDWTLPFDADTTNFAYNTYSSPNDLSFTFSGGRKLLLSMNVFMSTTGGTITIHDDLGQTISQFIPSDHVMHLITTGFTQPSNNIYISGITWGHNLGIDDITYKLPDNPPVIVQMQSTLDYGETATIHSAKFNGDNSIGNLIVVQVNWGSGASIQYINDSLGNVYTQALPVTSGPKGNMQQIWYAKNIKGGPNMVTVGLTASVYGDFSAHEYRGLDKISPLDVTAAAAGFGFTSNSGSVTTHFANELIFGGMYGDSVSGSDWDPGFTLREKTYQNNVAEDMVVTQVGTYSAGLTYSTGIWWIAQVVTFKGAP